MKAAEQRIRESTTARSWTPASLSTTSPVGYSCGTDIGMNLPEGAGAVGAKDDIIKRLDELIVMGEEILKTAKPPPPHWSAHDSVDERLFHQWRTSSVAFLVAKLGEQGAHTSSFQEKVAHPLESFPTNPLHVAGITDPSPLPALRRKTGTSKYRHLRRALAAGRLGAPGAVSGADLAFGAVRNL